MKEVRTVAIGVMLLLFIGGCQHSNPREAPRVMGEQKKSEYARTILENATQPKTEDLKIKKMELKAREEIEKIRAQKELEIARLKAESEKSKLLTQKELTIKKIQTQLEEILGDRKMVGWVIALSALFLFLLLWVTVKLFREYQNHRKRLEEARMAHEKELKEKEIQARLAEKMFEALGSGNLTEEQQNRLLDSLAGANRQISLKK
ncbi:hypothetical protein [Hydrogenimonas urashimensis]|uniref:hypothetical protein n=1 Tax=Hydrogenimonas urashimensis TaxID=2740515 RepID=UPI001915BAB8|nr:hypothetical protein [Hydrogenimonas urashimensis]